MRIFLIPIIFALLLQTANAKESIANKVEGLIHATDPNLNIGIKITNLDQDKVVFEKNADRYFIPASTLKFITIVTTLEYLGEDYNFTSTLLNKDQNYYLNIHDPDFSTIDLSYFVTKLVEHSGKIIKGNIYITNKNFSLPAMMRDKTLGDSTYCYGAPITLVHINKNCSVVNAAPAKIGNPCTITADQNFPYTIINNTKTIAKDQNDRLNITIKEANYIISGTLSQSTGPVTIAAVTNDNLSQIKYYLQKQLDNHGVALKGAVLIGNIPRNANIVAFITKNIKPLAATAMKKSDNFISDYLLAELASQYKLTEWDWVAPELKKIIFEKFKVDLAKTDLKDGSGIARQNLLTVNQFNSFLKAVAKGKNFELVKSILACPKDECTLHKRFENLDIYAKTGSLTGVSTLVGYFYNRKGELHSFVIMANNFYQGRALYHKLEEDIMRLVVE